MPRLQIFNRRERALVGAADGVLHGAAALARPFRRRQRTAVHRLLLLRLERIGDLLMALPAIADARTLAPGAEIDLVVGEWNADLARALTCVTRVLTLNPSWLAREGTGDGLGALMATARGWSRPQYDLAINFEPDIRSNLIAAAAGANWTAGYRSGGGGALLDLALDYDPGAHTTDNARRLVAAAFETMTPPLATSVLTIDRAASHRAASLLAEGRRPLVGMHVSGGRAIKQWDLDRFAEVGRRLVAARGATIVLTGSPADRPLVDEVKRELPADHVIDVAGQLDLMALAALLDQLDLLVTGDTGPMHLAAAVGTPIVAIFGPSDPRRYAPRGPHDVIVRVDLPCSPCNRIRQPPERCVGHTPDCLTSISSDRVFAAAASVLDSSNRGAQATAAGASA